MRVPIIAATGLLTASLTSVVVGSSVASEAVTEPEPGRPNVVLITADDMRADDLPYMPHTQELVGQLDLVDFISNHPLCCPARAEMLTGQFAQHSGVHHNGGRYGGYSSLRGKDNTLPAWLAAVGYRTGMTGKFMNGWRGNEEGDRVPAGWDVFDPLLGKGRAEYTPYDYEVYTGPRLPNLPAVEGEHTNDFVTRQSRARIAELAATGAPFFWWASYVAPHAMLADGRWVDAVPAGRHDGAMAEVVPPLEAKPSFRPYAGSRDRWRSRVESLLSVDEGVRDIVQTLSETGELDETVVIFTSDNGFLLGEHRDHGKNLPWEESLRVPLLATGPGVGVGSSAKGGMTVDLAPSIAALAGAVPGRVQDGRADLFAVAPGWATTLIQGGSERSHFAWRGTRTPRWTYVDWLGGRQQLFDRVEDPYQLHNLARERPRVRRHFAAMTPNPY